MRCSWEILSRVRQVRLCGRGVHVVIAGDFNAEFAVRGDSCPNVRGIDCARWENSLDSLSPIKIGFRFILCGKTDRFWMLLWCPRETSRLEGTYGDREFEYHHHILFLQASSPCLRRSINVVEGSAACRMEHVQHQI